MDPKYLRTLELPKILQQLAAHTSFSASHELALNLSPATDLDEVRRRQEETMEAGALLALKAGLSIGGARDVRPLLNDSRRGAILLPLQLLDIKATLLSGRVLRTTITRLRAQFPRLAEIAGRIEDCAHVVAEIRRCINERGEVVDDASPNLTLIRRELRLAHDWLMDRLNRLVTSPENAPFLQEALITQRGGRYVIPLKAECKGRIPGLIHDQSASGATLFIEPLATVELNNQWRELQLQEENEIRRILAGLSELVAQEADLIERTVEALAELDLAFAKAKYAQTLKAVSPILVPFSRPRASEEKGIQHPGTTIDLRKARHPLLNPATVVPIDVHLGPDYFVLVITGPNTGGKTVALKTVGLLAAMAQAGLAIPVEEGSRLSVFDGIYADIGDEQSIEQSLSTFSSHMTNIVDILRRATPQSLVLLDELGAGTDPEEGSALARAILSHVVQRSITTFATTHYSELKIYAHITPGVQNASVEFDPETLSPTYELTIGLPGRSNAFAIARRLGLPAEIIDHAAGMVSSESLQAESLLAQIKETQRQILLEQQRAAIAREEAERLRQELEGKLREIEAARQEIFEEARQQAHQELAALREELRQIRAQARMAWSSAAGSEALARLSELRQSLEKVEEEWEAREPAPSTWEPTSWTPPQVGDMVWVEGLNVTGEVIAVAGEEVEVQAGAFRARVPLHSVVVRPRSAAAPLESRPSKRPKPAGSHPPLELDLRGLRVEEALLRLEKYLDDAFLSDLPWVRIVHGKGTGALRHAVRERLSEHPHVASFRAGEAGEGGDGVTVVTFARL